MKSFLIKLITGVCLGITILAFGFALCALPPTTTMLCNTYSADALSPFSHDDLVYCGEATRDYTVGAHNRESLDRVLYEINTHLIDSGYAPKNSKMHLPDLPDSSDDIEAVQAGLATASYHFVLDENAISHLDDVYEVVAGVRLPLFLIAGVACVGLVFCGRKEGCAALGRVLRNTGRFVLALFCVCGLWAALNFSSFFAFFHSLFFANGTWTFPIDSLLICMYPQNFWIAMAGIWFAASAGASILAIVLGRILIRQAQSGTRPNSMATKQR